MRMRILLCFGILGIVVATAMAPVTVSAGVLDYPWWHSDPHTLADVARRIDCIHEKLLNQGTVVIKQPDVWSQARMTMFRKEFEETMQLDLTKFTPTLAARIARSDAASLQSQTAISAVLTPFGSATPGGTPFSPAITNQADFNRA